jgi:tetratricopeptide (TPR) repeat protein
MKQASTTKRINGHAHTNQMAAGLLGAVTALSLILTPPALAINEGFLKKTGARGPLAEEEELLYELRQQKEAAALQELEKVKEEYEAEARESILKNGSLCATPFGIDIVGISEFVALTGALVGGVSARRRKDEVEKLNEQLRTINTQLRQQARAGTLFAPGLTYVPPSVGGTVSGGGGAATATIAPPSTFTENTTTTATNTVMPQEEAINEEALFKPLAAPASQQRPDVSILTSLDEDEESIELTQCQAALKEGKRLLKEQSAGPAMVRFEKALMLAKSLGDKVRQRRAVRGLAASSRLSGHGNSAIKYLLQVLDISKEIGDYVGDADAFGTIADIYTDMGEFEKAAEYYDRYIRAMSSDGPV